MHYMDDDKAYGEKAWQQMHKNAVSRIEQIQEITSLQNGICTATYQPSQKPSRLDKQDTRDTAGEVRTK